MNVAVIGAGNMGRALGVALGAAGHRLAFMDRNEDKARAAVALVGGDAEVATADAAVAASHVVLWTLRGVLPSHVLQDPGVLTGKVLVDLNNTEIPPGFAFRPVVQSLAEALAKDVPGARVVKAFNTLAMEAYEHSAEALRRTGANTFLAGNDAAAKDTVAGLARDLGLSPVDVGPLVHARLLESLADLTRWLMMHGAGPLFSFGVRMLPAPEGSRLGGRQPAFFG